MDGRLHDLLRKQTQRADETAKRAIEDGAKSLKPGSLLNRARKRTGEKVAKGFRAEADAAYADVKKELDRIADAAADETARKIEALTGKPAKAARGAVDGRQLRADLRRSNARRAKNAERALGRAVKGTPPGKRDAAASEAAKSAWKDVAKSRQRKRFVDSRGRAWKDSVYNEMRAKTMEANAKRAAQIATLRANGFKLARISDGVQETTCEDCHLWRGGIVSLTGRAYRGYPALEKVVATTKLFHPNCIHYIEPYNPPKKSHYADISKRPEIDAIFSEANDEPRVNTKKSRQRNTQLRVGTPADDLAEAIKAATGFDVAGYEIVYDTFYKTEDTKTKRGEERGLGHAFLGHGTSVYRTNENGRRRRCGERRKGNVPLSIADLKRLPQALDDFSAIDYEGKTDRQGRPRFAVLTNEEDGVLWQGFAIDEKNKRLVFKTAYKEKPAP